MAHCSGLYSKLKDRNTAISDKLKLSIYSWVSEDVYLPNKEQVIIDVITGLLVNRKKLKLKETEVEAVWICLDRILKTRKAHIISQTGAGFIIKLSFCQVVFEVLQSWHPDSPNLTLLQSVLGCCKSIISSPVLKDVFTTKYDQLVQLLSHVLRITCNLVDENSSVLEVLSALLGDLINLYRRAERSNPNSKQVFESCVNKLLLPVSVLRYHLSSHQSTPLKSLLVQELEDVISTALFSRDHRDVYRSYLMTPDLTKTTPPKQITNLLSILQRALKREGEFQTLSSNTIGDSVVDYIPILFRYFITSFSGDTDMHHKMLSWFCDRVTEDEPISDECVQCMDSLFTIVQEYNVYDIAKDNSEGSTQLKFYRGLLDKLLVLKPSPILIGCLNTLLQLNHGIVEPKVKVILGLCWSAEYKNNAVLQKRWDELLCNLVKTYVQLRQLPKLLDRLLSQLNSLPDLPVHTQCPRGFLQVFGSQSLPVGTMFEIWGRFLDEISDPYLTSLKKDGRMIPNLCLVVELFVTFLENICVVDPSIPEASLQRLAQLLDRLQDTLQNLSSLLNIKEMNSNLVYSVLSLSHTWAELMLITKGDSYIDTPQSGATSHLDFSLVHPYLASDQWRRLSQHIIKHGDSKCQYVLTRLQVQKLSCLGMSEDRPGQSISVENLIHHLLSLLTPANKHSHWDGYPLTLTKSTLPAAHWTIVKDYLPLITPLLSESHLQTLASHIVMTTATAQSDLCNNSSLLKSPFLCEQSDLLAAILKTVWTLVKGQLCCQNNSPRKKKRKDPTQSLVCDIMETLCSETIDWRTVGKTTDSEVVGHMTSLSSSLTHLLSTPSSESFTVDDTLIKYIQVLGELPLEYLLSGQQVCCLSGLLSLLTLGLSPAPQHPSDLQYKLVKATTHLITSIIESQPKCPFLHFIETRTLLTWCENFVCWIQNQDELEPELRSLCRLTLEFIIRGVIRDFVLLPKLLPYINSTPEKFKKMKVLVKKDVALLTVITSVMEELTKLSDWTYLKGDIREICYNYVAKLAGPCLTLTDSISQDESSSLPLSVTYRCYTALLIITYSKNADKEEKKEHTFSGVETQLNKLIEGALNSILNAQAANLFSVLDFIKAVCHHSDQLLSNFTVDHRNKLWKKLEDCLLLLLQQQQQQQQHSTTRDMEICSVNRTVEEESTQSYGAFETRDITSVANTLAVLLSSSPADAFTPLLESVVNNCCSHHICVEPWRVQYSVLIWDNLLTCDLPQQHMDSFSKAVHNMLFGCQSVAQALCCRADTRYYRDLLIPVLKIQARMIQFGQVIMCGETAILSLHCCQYSLLEECPGKDYQSVFTSVYHLLNSLLVNFTDTVLSTLPAFINALNLLMKSLIQRADQGRSGVTEVKRSEVKKPAPVKDSPPVNTHEVVDLIQCAHQLDRLFTLMSSYKVEVGKVAPYMVAEYVSEVQQVTLIPAVKKALIPAIYSVIDICDKHGIALLHTVLSAGLTETFKLLYEDYNKHYRYSGRV